MNFKFLAFIIVLATLFSCKSKVAYNYNEWIVSKETSLAPDIERTENKVEVFVTEENYDSMAIVSERMEQLVEDKLNEIKDKPAPDLKEAENLKRASIRYFNFLKSIYTSYKNFALKKTDEDRDLERKRMIAIVDGKSRAISDMQAAQYKFAKANGFRLQK